MPTTLEQLDTTRLALLGPLQLTREGAQIAVPAPKHRALLAILAINANRTVRVDRIIAELWQGDQPKSARKTLQGHVWRLRGLLGRAALRTSGDGYVLLSPADAIDSVRFEARAGAGRAALRAGDARSAHQLLTEALGLWRGPALADVPATPTVDAYACRLEESRLVATEALLEAELALGWHAEAVPALRELVATHPLRESLRAQLMLALFRGGRQAEALAEFGRLRGRLAEDLGLDPGRELVRLHQRILAADPALHLG